MTKKSINYYGYDADTYRDCLSQIRQTNKEHLFMLNAWFTAMNALYLFFCLTNFFGVTRERVWFFLVYFLIGILILLLQIFASPFLDRTNIPLVFINIFVMLSYGIFSSIAQPYMPATIFLVFFLLIAIAYIKTFARMTAALVLMGIIFIASSFSKKTFSIAYYDTYNFVLVFILSIGLHYTFQHTRMEQFTLYFRNLQIQQELEVKSSFDALTSLLNRARFFSIAEEILRSGKDGYTALCLLDLDGFKQINDEMGHQMGDKAIQITGKTVAETLRLDLSEKWTLPDRIVREKFSFAGRLGGDEFIIFIKGKSSREEVESLLQEFLDALNHVQMNGLDGLHASLGFTELTERERDIDAAYKRADDALYKSKRAGKNQISFTAAEEATA